MSTAAPSATASPANPPESRARILPGDPAPWFTLGTAGTRDFRFDGAAGRYAVLCFYGSAGDAEGRAAVDAVLARRSLFDGVRASFYGVSFDPRDASENRVSDSTPGIRHFLDFEGVAGRLYGALPPKGPADPASAQRFWVLLDPMLRCLAVRPLGEHEAFLAALERLPPPERFAGFELPVPVLLLPRVFEPSLCRTLIDLYEQHGGEASGISSIVDGKSVQVQRASFKMRRDYIVADPAVIRQLHLRLVRRVLPEIEKVHFFKPTRIERNIVSCYAAEDGGHFNAHRDNTTAATAHRRFAVSINLNDAFEGGEVSFPEFSRRAFKAPPGGAVVFATPLLHAVSRVTAGRRYAFLPFLYDDEAAKLMQANAGAPGEASG
jgi:predicted 2-oxoglutarate/Fe(II)-dependent dioxygenase YbiX/peroxiredoxin